MDKALIERIRQKRTDGTWEQTVEAYKTNYALGDERAEERLTEDLRKEVLTEAQSVAPGRTTTWTFSNIHPQGRTYHGPGQVVQAAAQTGMVALQADPDLVSRLVVFGPVWVRQVGPARPPRRRGRQAGPAGFRCRQGGHRASAADVAGRLPRRLHAGGHEGCPAFGRPPGGILEIVAEPTIQVSYKISPAEHDGNTTTRAAWNLENPTNGAVYQIGAEQVLINTKGTLIAPLRVVDEKGNLRVRYLNYSTSSVTVLNSDMAVLYEVGSFEANFAKTIGLILAGLMFLAALGIFGAAPCRSPWGASCASCCCGSHRAAFLTESIGTGLDYGTAKELTFIYQLGAWMLATMKVLMPDLWRAATTSWWRG